MRKLSKTTLDRYKHEKDHIIIEVAVKNSRQLFNERDPAPFRERDLDPQFVIYILSSVEEFSIRTKMKIRIIIGEDFDLKTESKDIIRQAIQTYFQYESTLAQSNLSKRYRSARYLFLIGLLTLIVCLSVAQFMSTTQYSPSIANVVSVGFVIIGWVAMWRPIEDLLYSWWPIREQRLYFNKISMMAIEIVRAQIDSAETPPNKLVIHK